MSVCLFCACMWMCLDVCVFNSVCVCVCVCLCVCVLYLCMHVSITSDPFVIEQ